MDNPTLLRLLLDVHALDVQQSEEYFVRERGSCLTPIRACALVYNADRWTDAERAHVTSCSYCARMLELYEDKVWHPSWWLLMRRALGLLSKDDEETVAYHLQNDACQFCRDRCGRIDRTCDSCRESVVSFGAAVPMTNPSAWKADGGGEEYQPHDWLELGIAEASPDIANRLAQLLTGGSVHIRECVLRAIPEIIRGMKPEVVRGMKICLSDQDKSLLRLAAEGEQAATEEILECLHEMKDREHECSDDTSMLALNKERPTWYRELVEAGLEAQFMEVENEVLLEIRSKNANFLNRLLGCGFRGKTKGSPFLHFVVLHPDRNDWYTAQIRFDIRELYDQIDGECHDVLIGPVDVNDLTSEEGEALLESVKRDRNDERARTAWVDWAGHVKKEPEPLPDRIAQLLAEVNDQLQLQA